MSYTLCTVISIISNKTTYITRQDYNNIILFCFLHYCQSSMRICDMLLKDNFKEACRRSAKA